MEWKKVLREKKLVVFLLLLLGVQQLLFWDNAERAHRKWEAVYQIPYEQYHQQKEEMHIGNFHEMAEGIITQAESMGSISIFAEEDSFSRRNLELTKEDYRVLLAVEPKLFDNRFLTDFFADVTRNVMMLFAMAGVTFVYVDENKAGLRGMIFSAVNGRERMVLRRMGALFGWAMCFSLLFGGMNLAVSCMMYEENVWEYASYPIQSLSMFGRLPVQISIGGFLPVYFLYQGVVLFLAGLGIWTVLFCVEYILLAVGVIGAVGIVTFLLYYLTDAKHPLGVLHYCNPWYLMNGSSIFCEYQNLNLMGWAVNKNIVILVYGVLLFVCYSAAGLLVGCWRYPCSFATGTLRRFVRHMESSVQKTVDTWVSRCGLMGMEFYKVLVGQKGILVIFVLSMVFLYQSDFTDIQLTSRQQMYFDFMEAHEGKPDAESNEAIQALEDLLREVETTYLAAAESYEKGELSASEWMFHSTRYLDFEQDRAFLEEIQKQTEHIENLRTERGISAWYVNCYSYNKILNEESMLANGLLLFGTILLTSGVFVGEKKAGIQNTLRASMLGRKELLQKKFLVAFVLSLLLFFVISVLEFATVDYVYGFSGWSAPVQSILMLGDVPLECSIGVYFFGMYLLKAIGVLAVAAVCGFFYLGSQDFRTL